MSEGIDLGLEGRCASCSFFVEDYGDKKATYGHCGRKPRIGSVTGRDYKCEDYRIRPDYRRAIEELGGGASRGSAPAASAAAAPSPSRSQGFRDPGPAERTPALAQDAPSTDPEGPRRVRVSGGGGGGDAGTRVDDDRLRRIVADAIDDLLGLSELRLADRWVGGSLVLRPANPALQEKVVELERFWSKIVMVREQLRNLERAVNTHGALSGEDKIQLQQYITRCYGSLTTFNVLFRDKDVQFRGQKKDD